MPNSVAPRGTSGTSGAARDGTSLAWIVSYPTSRCVSMRRGACRSRLPIVPCWRATGSTASIAIRRWTSLQWSGRQRAARRDRSVDRDLSPYSDERDAFTLSLYGTSETLKIDGEGRVIFSDALKTHAGITEAIAFVGLGHKFQIWEPDASARNPRAATGTVRALKKQLGSRVAAHEAHKARE